MNGEMEYTLTGEDVLKILQGMVGQNFEAAKLAQVQHLLRNTPGVTIGEEVTQGIHRFLLGVEGRERNLAAEVKEWVVATDGVFDATQCVKELGLATKGDKRNVNKVLERLKNEGIIDRYGDKRGCYRLRETDLQAMDIMSPSQQPLDLIYPFYLHTVFVTLPRNIIIVAGEPDSGKTALLMQIVWANKAKFDIHYFNSEMGEMELRSRLSKFGKPLAEWQKVHFWERSSNFADVIRPDAINVIDFLEVTEDFWKIGTWIKQIHDRLRRGIAIIAIQKARGAAVGRGGHVTLEKPRLYLNMEPGKITIVKCKNWREEDFNPNGQELKFRLVKGCEFIIDEYWKKSGALAPKKTRSYPDFVSEGAA
jgi:hypothetical protein